MQWSNIKLYKDLAECPDSLLFDSGTVIAELKSLDNRYCVDISVQGRARLFYKGARYDCPSEFPEDVVNAIKDGALYDLDDVYIDSNNWFELSIYDNGEYIDGEVWEAPLDTYTPDDLYSEIIQYLEEEFKFYEESRQ